MKTEKKQTLMLCVPSIERTSSDSYIFKHARNTRNIILHRETIIGLFLSFFSIVSPPSEVTIPLERRHLQAVKVKENEKIRNGDD